MCANSLIQHPSRTLICGRAKSGKSHLFVKLLDQQLRNQIDRLIVICPTWHQKLFDPIRDLVKNEEDVIENFDKDPFHKIYDQLVYIKKQCEKKGIATPNTLIFVDDMAGSKFLHGGRINKFSLLSIQTTHWNTSIVVITQAPKAITPSFRDNLENLITFPLNKSEDQEWLFKEFNGNMFNKKRFKKIIKIAWSSFDGRYGEHFLFIHLPIRSETRYFSDFKYELTPKRKVKKNIKMPDMIE